MADPDPKTNRASDAELTERLDSLRAKLDMPENAGVEQQKAASSAKTSSGMAQAFKLSSEFIAGIVVGAGIGYGFDQLFGTTPWGFIFFFLIGFAAAILNVLRSAGMVAESEMRLKPAHKLSEKREDADADQSGTQ